MLKESEGIITREIKQWMGYKGLVLDDRFKKGHVLIREKRDQDEWDLMDFWQYGNGNPRLW
jgi:hypothetical protein